jgi:hypothetical protein
MHVCYDPTATMRTARARYFEANAFGADGGYSAKWVDVKLGPVPFPFPNTPSRVRAVRYHDLHHVLTGYDTDIAGEFEISAWEIAAGCRTYVAAWVLNLSGMVGGLVRCPRRTFRAFVRGRRSQSLYARDYEALLDRTVAEVRREVSLDRADATDLRATLADATLFELSIAAGLVVGTFFLALTIPVLPFAILGLRAAKSRAAAAAPLAAPPPT